MRPLKVLVVEDSRFAADVNIRQIKKSGFDVEYQIASDETAMESALKEQEWDLIISDNCMPSFTALGALAIRNRLGLEIPFIIVSEFMPEGDISCAYTQGLTAFIPKGNLPELGLLVQRLFSQYRIPF